MNVPLPETLGPCKDFPKIQEVLINYFNPDQRLLRTPGIDNFAAGVGFARGGGTFLNAPYFLSGTKLVSVAENGAITENATPILGQQEAVFAPSFAEMAICIIAGEGWVLDNTGALTEITDPDWQSSKDVDTIEGVAVWVPVDGGPLFYSDQNDFLSYSSLKYFDAESLPDINVGVINCRNTLFALGTDSIEMFRTTGDANAKFVPVLQGQCQTGYIAGKILTSTSFAFLGRERNGGPSFYVMGSGAADRISTEFIDELLTEYTPVELATCRGHRFKWKGHSLIVWNLPRTSFVYQEATGRWSLMESGFNGPEFQTRWRGNLILYAYGKYLVGDFNSAAIGALSDSNIELGSPIEREFTTFIKSERESYFTLNSVILDCLVGQQLTGGQIGTVGLRMSDDGYSYYDNEAFRTLFATGRYKGIVSWSMPGGLGSYESFCGLRFRVTANVDIGVDSVQVEL